MFDDLARRIEHADDAGTLPVKNSSAAPPPDLNEEPSPTEDEIARMFDAAQTVTTVRGRLVEHVAPLPFVLDLDLDLDDDGS